MLTRKKLQVELYARQLEVDLFRKDNIRLWNLNRELKSKLEDSGIDMTPLSVRQIESVVTNTAFNALEQLYEIIQEVAQNAIKEIAALTGEHIFTVSQRVFDGKEMDILKLLEAAKTSRNILDE